MRNRKRLLNIAAAIAMTNTDIRLAYNEENETTDINEEAAHFLNHKEKRVGRDIELYAFLCEIEGEVAMLCDFLGEIILPLKLQGSLSAQAVEDWGIELLDKECWDDWRGLFREGL